MSRSRAAAGQVTAHPAYGVLVAVGLASYGIVHLLLAWIALQVAFGRGGNASNQGALQQLARQPFGTVLLLVMGIGLLALVLWQGIEAVLGARGADSKERLKNRVRSAGRAAVYLALGLSALRLVVGAGSVGGSTEQTFTARLLSVPFGRVLVVIVGLVVIGVGVSQIVKGVKRKFTEDLQSGVSRPVLALGTAGYVAKGVALTVIGILFGLAAITYDAERAGGMDAALTTIRDQPFGPYLLTVIAAGIACFGVFCFVWARHARRGSIDTRGFTHE